MIDQIKNEMLLKSNKYEKNNENIIGNISFVNGYTIVNDKKIYNKNISDKLYFNPDTGKLNCSNIEIPFMVMVVTYRVLSNNLKLMI